MQGQLVGGTSWPWRISTVFRCRVADDQRNNWHLSNRYNNGLDFFFECRTYSPPTKVLIILKTDLVRNCHKENDL